MKKVFLVLLVLTLTGCGGIDSISKRKNNEQNKLTDLFTKEREFVEIVAFFDFLSKDSRKAIDVLSQMEKEFQNKVQVTRLSFPANEKSSLIAEATECARDQEKFTAFLDEYFSNHFQELDEDTFLEIALRVSIDAEEFQTCRQSGIMKNRIAQYKALATENNVSKIPFFLIDKEITFSHVLPAENFSRLITDRLATPVEY